MLINLSTFFSSCNLNLLSDAANIVLALGIIIAAFTYRSTRKGNYLQTIENCSKEYRGYMRQIQKEKYKSTLVEDMLGLFHKQLFYIKNNYVPKEIKIEWLVTMHSVLIDKEYKDKGLQFCEKDCEKSFSRVKDFIELNDKGFSTSDSRKKTKSIKKAYRKYYFTAMEGICLNRNNQWENAFDINNKHE